MTAHELARKLLDGPDVPVFTWSEDSSQHAPIVKAEVRHPLSDEEIKKMFVGEDDISYAMRMRHRSAQLYNEDALGNPMPAEYVYLDFDR